MKRQFYEWKQHVRGIYRTCAMIVAVMAVSAGGVEFAGGRGEPNDPYQIATAEQLIAMGSDPNAMTKHFLLVADIDLDPNLPGRRVFDRAVVAATQVPTHHLVIRLRLTDGSTVVDTSSAI